MTASKSRRVANGYCNPLWFAEDGNVDDADLDAWQNASAFVFHEDDVQSGIDEIERNQAQSA